MKTYMKGVCFNGISLMHPISDEVLKMLKNEVCEGTEYNNNKVGL